jgi:hypothetical protein
MLASSALMASNFPFAQIDKIQVPGTPVSVPAVFFWLFFVFLFVPFTNEVRASNLQLKYKLGKKFNSALATWSRKKKEKHQPELYTPQLLVSSQGWNLKWEYKYCQAGANLEPSYTAVSGALNTIRLFLWACINIFLSTEILERFTLPVARAISAIAMKMYFLWAHP